jgi:hypothetical protein
MRDPATREVRTFGATLVGGAAVFGFAAWRRGFATAQTSAAVVLLAVGLFAIAAPRIARPLHRAWMGIGHALGRVTTPIVLTLVFFGVLTPARWLLALFGRDPLQRRREPALTTYWQDRPRRTFGRDDFERLS